MSELEEQIRIAKHFVAHVASGGIEKDYYADDMTVWTVTTGLLEIKDYLPRLNRAKNVWKEPLVMTFDSVTAQPGRVVVQARGRGVPTTGEVYTQDYLVLVEFTEGNKIKHVREYFDVERLERILRPALTQWGPLQGITK
jgi:ketosteroid isomerase-like protein